MENLSLKDKTAVVCGASQGIGRACAEVMAGLGATIIAVARNEEKLKKMISSLPGAGHSYYAADLGHRAQLDKLCAELKNKKVHILFNNAGGPKPGPIEKAEPAEFEAALQMHLIANSKLAQAVLPQMREQRYGRIINMTSTSVKTPLPNLGVSNATRWAVAAWAKTLAQEVAAAGITVNTVLPGMTSTERLETLAQGAAEKSSMTEQQVREGWLKTIPAARFGEPQEIARVVAFLASPWASYVNGVALAVDGGRTACL